MGEEKSVVIKLTSEQREAIRNTTGHDIAELKVEAGGDEVAAVLEARQAPWARQELRKAPFAAQEERKAPFTAETDRKAPFTAETDRKAPFTAETDRKAPLAPKDVK